MMTTFYKAAEDDDCYLDVDLMEYVGTESEVRELYPECIILEVVKG